jgi:hypothetical protein
MNWVVEEVEGKMLAPVAPEEVEWMETDEPWSYTTFHPVSPFTPILLTTDCTDKTDCTDV